MSTLSKAGLASTLAYMVSMSAAGAQDVDIIVDGNMATDLYRISEDWNIPGTSTITRAIHDRAAEVYCEWQVVSDIDKDYNISNLRTANQFCKAAEPSDTDQWTIGDVNSMNDIMHNQRYVVEPDVANNIVLERAPNGPNPGTEVYSEFRREWNFNTSQVCVSGFEGQKDQAPYLNLDLGCHDMPDNAHVDSIRARLDM